MKQLEPINVTVNKTNFHIFPFPAFKAANLSGELIALFGPMAGGLVAILGGDGNDSSNPLDLDVEKAAPALATAFDSLSGDKVEAILRKLLVTSRNITVDMDDGTAEYLTEDMINEIFCAEVQGMYVLAFHVIKTNFGGFFAKLGSLSGSASEKVKKVAEKFTDTEN